MKKIFFTIKLCLQKASRSGRYLWQTLTTLFECKLKFSVISREHAIQLTGAADSNSVVVSVVVSVVSVVVVAAAAVVVVVVVVVWFFCFVAFSFSMQLPVCELRQQRAALEFLIFSWRFRAPLPPARPPPSVHHTSTAPSESIAYTNVFCIHHSILRSMKSISQSS